MPDYMPGAPLGYSPGSRVYGEERIHATIADAELAVDELAQKLGDRLIAELAPALEVETELRGRMEGTAANEIEAAEATVAKLREKLEQRVIDRVTEAYQIAIPLGYTVPTTDDMIAESAMSPAPVTQPVPAEPSAEPKDAEPFGEPHNGCPGGQPRPRPPLPGDTCADDCPYMNLGPGFQCGMRNGAWVCWSDWEVCIPWLSICPEERPPLPAEPLSPMHPCHPGPLPDDSGCWTVKWFVREPCNGQPIVVISDIGPPPGWQCDLKAQYVRKAECGPTSPVPPKPGPKPPEPAKCPEVCPADFQEKDPVCKPPKDDPVIPDPPKVPDDKGYCEKMDDIIDAAAFAEVQALITAVDCTGGGGTISRAISNSIIGKDAPIIPATINRFAAWMQKIVKKIVDRSQCNVVKLGQLAPFHAALKFLSQWFGIVPKAVMNSFQQMENLTCQTVMPDQQSTDSARLADTIKQERWECWTRLNGSVVSAAEIGVETRRTRPDPLQLCRLFRQDKLKEDEWKKRIRQDGVIKDEDRQAFLDLTQNWPTASDLNPWMIRDVWDNKNIDWKEVDDLFEQKFTGESEKLFKAIGWTKDLAKLAWRAHFHLPSFTMVAEMYHRYRNLPEGDPLRTDIKKVRSLLIQDDWHPDWIDRMLAITFRPMRLVDIRNAYNLRAIDDSELQNRLRVLGYDDATVDITYRFWKRQREIRDARQGGIPSVKQLISKYANCEIDHGTFRSLVSLVVETSEQEQYAIQAAEIARDSEDARRTIAGISWQYRRGIIDESEAYQFLAQAGIDPSCIPSLVQRMKRQAGQKPKQLTAGSLCTMLERGIITQGEFVSALMRSGWTPQDAARIMQSCSVGLTVKEMRRARSEADRLAREQRRLEREAAKASRLAECGPVPCPANRAKPNQNGAGDPSIPDQT